MTETDPNHKNNPIFINTTDKETKTYEFAKKILFLFRPQQNFHRTLYIQMRIAILLIKHLCLVT